MTTPPPRPRGELGRAFAELAEPTPPSTLGAADIIREADRQSARRGRWVVVGGLAAAALAVVAVIGVALSGTSGTTSGSAVAASAASSSGGSAAGGRSSAAGSGYLPAPSVNATPSRGSAASAPTRPGSSPVPEADGEQAASGVCGAVGSLSADQQRILVADLPGLASSTVACRTDGTQVYTSDAVVVSVRIGAVTATGCPSLPSGPATCAAVDGHPDVTLVYADRTTPPDDAWYATLTAGTVQRSVSVDVRSVDGISPIPYSIDQLSDLVEELLAG